MRSANKIDPFRRKRITHVAGYVRKNYHSMFCPNPERHLYIDSNLKMYSCFNKINYLGTVDCADSINRANKAPARLELASVMKKSIPPECKEHIRCKNCHKQNDNLMYSTQSTIDQIQAITVEYSDAFFENTNFDLFRNLKHICFVFNSKFDESDLIQSLVQLYFAADQIHLSFHFLNESQINFLNKLEQQSFIIEQIKIGFSIEDKSKLQQDLENEIEFLTQFSAQQGVKQNFAVDVNIVLTINERLWKYIPTTFQISKIRGLRPTITLCPNLSEKLSDERHKDLASDIFSYYLNLSSDYDFVFNCFYEAFESLFSKNPSVYFKKVESLFKIKNTSIRIRKNKMCTQPFSQIAIFPTGDINPCCWLHGYYLKKHEPTAPHFLDIWNGIEIRKLRKEFLDGNTEICKKNISESSCNVRDFLHQDLSDFEEHLSGPIPKIHWSFNGKCNLSCQMCNNWQYKDEFEGSDQYWDQLKAEVLPYLCEIELAGGEPFYQKRTFDLINFIAQVNPQCVWRIITNGQLGFEGAIKTAISKIRIGQFSVSIDSLNPDIFRKIRINGELHKAISFLDHLILFNKSLPTDFQFEIRINFLLQKQNWRELKSIIDFSKEKGVNVFISILTEPRQFSILDMPEPSRKKVVEHLEDLIQTSYQENLPSILESLKSLLN